MKDVVAFRVFETEGEAMVCLATLKLAGIQSRVANEFRPEVIYGRTPYRVLVNARDLDRAQEVLESAEPINAPQFSMGACPRCRSTNTTGAMRKGDRGPLGLSEPSRAWVCVCNACQHEWPDD